MVGGCNRGEEEECESEGGGESDTGGEDGEVEDGGGRVFCWDSGDVCVD